MTVTRMKPLGRAPFFCRCAVQGSRVANTHTQLLNNHAATFGSQFSFSASQFSLISCVQWESENFVLRSMENKSYWRARPHGVLSSPQTHADTLQPTRSLHALFVVVLTFVVNPTFATIAHNYGQNQPAVASEQKPCSQPHHVEQTGSKRVGPKTSDDKLNSSRSRFT